MYINFSFNSCFFNRVHVSRKRVSYERAAMNSCLTRPWRILSSLLIRVIRKLLVRALDSSNYLSPSWLSRALNADREGELKRGRFSTSDWWSPVERRSAPTGIATPVGRVNMSRIVFRAINQRDLISRVDGEKMRVCNFAVTLRPFPSYRLCSAGSARGYSQNYIRASARTNKIIGEKTFGKKEFFPKWGKKNEWGDVTM